MNLVKKAGVIIALSVLIIGGGIYSIEKDRVNSKNILDERNVFEEKNFKEDLSKIDSFKTSLLNLDGDYKYELTSFAASQVYLQTFLDRVGYKKETYEQLLKLKTKDENFKFLDEAIAKNNLDNLVTPVSEKEYNFYKKTFEKLKEQSIKTMNEDKKFVSDFLNKGSYYKKIGGQMSIKMEKEYQVLNHLNESIDFILQSNEQVNNFVKFRPTQLKISHILLTSNSHPEIQISKNDCNFLEKINNITWIEDNNIKCVSENK